jgi:chromosome segregation ATPase
MEDDRFKAEMTRMMGSVIKKLDAYEIRFDNLEEKVDKNSRDLRLLKKEVRMTSGRLSDVISKVIDMLNRLSEIEKEVKVLSVNKSDFESEIKNISTELRLLTEKLEELPEKVEVLRNLDLRLERLEERVFA